MLLFSLAGIPPLAGFFAKFYVFLGGDQGRAVHARRRSACVTSVVGAYYYLAIVKIMYFDEPAKAFEPMPHELQGGARASPGCSICCSSSIPAR